MLCVCVLYEHSHSGDSFIDTRINCASAYEREDIIKIQSCSKQSSVDRENGFLTRGSLEKRRCLNVILKYKQKKISYTDNPRRRILIDRTTIVIIVAVMKIRLVMYAVDENERC